MIEPQEIRRRLAALGKNQAWLAKQLKLSDNTVRQYMGPKGKRTAEFQEQVVRILALEAARQQEVRADALPWNQVFDTAEEFDRADRASRVIGAESLKEFCRETILARADEILARQKRGKYGKLDALPSPKVAEEE